MCISVPLKNHKMLDSHVIFHTLKWQFHVCYLLHFNILVGIKSTCYLFVAVAFFSFPFFVAYILNYRNYRLCVNLCRKLIFSVVVNSKN